MGFTPCPVLWIWICKDPHHFGKLDPQPDPDPHQIKIRVRIKKYKLDPDPDPHQLADVKPKCIEYEPIKEIFQGFEPFFKLGSGSGSGSTSGSKVGSGSASNIENQNPDLH